MKVFLISFGSTEYNDDEALRAQICRIGATICLFGNTIVLKTGLERADEIEKRLKKHQAHTNIIISELTTNMQGWLAEENWDWICEHEK